MLDWLVARCTLTNLMPGPIDMQLASALRVVDIPAVNSVFSELFTLPKYSKGHPHTAPPPKFRGL